MDITAIKTQLEEADKTRKELESVLGVEPTSKPNLHIETSGPEDLTGSYGHLIGQLVIVRTRMSGVSIGTLRSVQTTAAGYSVVLDDALRLWRWEGAFTLSEIALTGPTKKARTDKHPDGMVISEPAIELLPMTDAAFAQLESVNS